MHNGIKIGDAINRVGVGKLDFVVRANQNNIRIIEVRRSGVGVDASPPTGRCWRSFSGLFTGVAAGEEARGLAGGPPSPSVVGPSLQGTAGIPSLRGDCMMCSL